MTVRARPVREPRAGRRRAGTLESRANRFSTMGYLYYGGSDPIHIDDRPLAHLKVVIATKLRRNESFTLTWRHPDDQPQGRSTVWLHPSIPLRFVFDEPEATSLSRRWIEALALSANSTGGVMLVDELLDPPEDPPVG